tara:strand:+ start:655 stop:2451 length:1797 start_codon:yes stop_codon:yes gene_type:complete
MADQQKKILPINYTNRDYESIRDDLLEIAERYYPDTFQDFSEASFGSLMLDAVAYVGDQLSFYLDYNVNESFMDTSYQYNNILRHGRILGYKNTGRPSTYGTVALFALVPASPTGIGPDSRYTPILKRGSTFSTDTGLSFMLTENVDFNKPGTVVVVGRVDTDTGAPTHYAIKAYGNVVSGEMSSEKIDTGPFERFKRLKLGGSNISEIISVVDGDGNEYYEVDYLSQDIVYKEIPNLNYQNDNVASILKPFLVSRKFVLERDRFSAYLQFGSGKSGETNVVADPQRVALDIFGKDYVTDTTFDPSRLTRNENLGIVPSNTTLTVTYRSTNPTNSNIGAGGINSLSAVDADFADRSVLAAGTMQEVLDSIEVSNETPIVGDVSNASSAELKRRVFDTFSTQNRAVTQSDYENLVYRMPAKFGAIKRCSTQKDPNSAKRNLNMYVVSVDDFGNLTMPNMTIKNNLKTWLNRHRMINDTVDILNPYLINIGIDFIIRAASNVDKFDLLEKCVETLSRKYSEHFYIGEHLYISDIYAELKKVEGVLDVVKVKINNKTGAAYSSTKIDINKNMSPDGNYLIVPKNAILELKYPDTDIKGKVR